MTTITECKYLKSEGKCGIGGCAGQLVRSKLVGKEYAYPSLTCLQNSFGGRLYLASLRLVGFGWIWGK